MENGTEFQLKLVRWEFFGTLTWSSSKLGSVRSRDKQVWEFFREIAAECAQKLHHLPIVVRWERGETGDRPHAHFLLTGTNKANIGNCFNLMARWSKAFGFARVRLYDSAGFDFARYVQKGLESLSSGQQKANTYELRKFDFADRLDINAAAWAEMCRAAGVHDAPQR